MGEISCDPLVHRYVCAYDYGRSDRIWQDEPLRCEVGESS